MTADPAAEAVPAEAEADDPEKEAEAAEAARIAEAGKDPSPTDPAPATVNPPREMSKKEIDDEAARARASSEG
jgi:hypothetical protein